MAGPGLFTDIGKKAKDLLTRDYSYDQKLSISTYSVAGVVALRLKQNGYTGCSAGDTVPYIICCLQDSGSGSLGIAQRARHLDELKKENSGWMIDIEYYLSQQIHPVVSRLCAFIEGTSPARLADYLGLDSSKFQIKTTSESLSKDPSTILLSVIDDEERYHGCEPLQLSCPSCSSTFDCPPVSTLISPPSNSSVTQSVVVPQRNFWHKMRCPRCPDSIESSIISPATLANQVKRQAENYISLYYKGMMMVLISITHVVVHDGSPEKDKEYLFLFCELKGDPEKYRQVLSDMELVMRWKCSPFESINCQYVSDDPSVPKSVVIAKQVIVENKLIIGLSEILECLWDFYTELGLQKDLYGYKMYEELLLNFWEKNKREPTLEEIKDKFCQGYFPTDKSTKFCSLTTCLKPTPGKLCYGNLIYEVDDLGVGEELLSYYCEFHQRNMRIRSSSSCQST